MKNEIEIKVTEGWYLCIRDNKEAPMYIDSNGKWHLSSYHTNDVVHRRIAKSPDKVVKRMSR